MPRRKFNWTGKQIIKLDKVIQILNELAVYKPLTLRQIYYQLVGQGYIDNKVSQYNMLSKLLKWARIDGLIKWEDIEDRVRSYHNLTGWTSAQAFIDAHLKVFLNGYSRNLLQSQDKYLEIWIEKDALSSIFTRVARDYTIPVVVCRGFSSVSFLNDFKDRLQSKGVERVMLYFGDFDPSGMEMLEAMRTTMIDELGVYDIEFKRVALLQEDIERYNLPNNPNALKRTDTRAQKHIDAYGEIAVELDALRPDVLEAKIQEAVEGEIDADAFNREVRQHDQDLEGLKALKERVVDVGLEPWLKKDDFWGIT